jgi:hypothetical protein
MAYPRRARRGCGSPSTLIARPSSITRRAPQRGWQRPQNVRPISVTGACLRSSQGPPSWSQYTSERRGTITPGDTRGRYRHQPAVCEALTGGRINRFRQYGHGSISRETPPGTQRKKFNAELADTSQRSRRRRRARRLILGFFLCGLREASVNSVLRSLAAATGPRCATNPGLLRSARRFFLLVTRHSPLVTRRHLGCGHRPRWVSGPCHGTRRVYTNFTRSRKRECWWR